MHQKITDKLGIFGGEGLANADKGWQRGVGRLVNCCQSLKGMGGDQDYLKMADRSYEQ